MGHAPGAGAAWLGGVGLVLPHPGLQPRSLRTQVLQGGPGLSGGRCHLRQRDAGAVPGGGTGPAAGGVGAAGWPSGQLRGAGAGWELAEQELGLGRASQGAGQGGGGQVAKAWA